MSSIASSSNPLIKANNIGISFGERQILSNVSLQVDQGRIVTLIGPNGAGKTTLVRIILGLLRADSGKITRAAGLKIGYMPQKIHIEPTLPITVKRFLELTGIRDQTTIDRLLEELRVGHLKQQQLRSVSGGELQRVLMCRALLRKPGLLVLDEPAQGVDVSGQAELYKLISGIAERYNCGILMISHDLHLVMSSTHEVICLNHHVCCQGKPEQVSSDPAYLSLFGETTVDNIAVYTHNHNHSHDIKGDVVREPDNDG